MEMEGFVDYKGRPVSRTTTGGWMSARYVLVEEVAERFAFSGVYSNLINFLTGQLGMSTAAAAAGVNAWYGASGLLPTVMGFVADAYVGKFWMIVFSALLYILTLFLLATMAGLNPIQNMAQECPSCVSTSQVTLTFIVLYAMTVAQGGHKPCAQAFGADQFDGSDPVESRLKSSFFNWWYVAMYVGNLAGIVVLNYVQENVSWVLGFGIPGATMLVSLFVFLLGTKRYRNHVLDENSPGAKIGRALRRHWTSLTKSGKSMLKVPLLHENKSSYNTDTEHPDKEQQLSGAEPELDLYHTTAKEEEPLNILQLLPVWMISLIYAIIFAQPPTLFTKQGSTLDRNITSNLTIPAATLQSLICITIALFVPVYDRVLVPALRSVTSNPSGLSTLQRIGVGILLSALSMVIAAYVESHRLRVAIEHGIVDSPDVPVPMSLWWLLPQYVVFGMAESLTNVGLLEFFYDEMPRGMRSLGLGFYLSIFGIGSLLSSLLISVLDKGTDWFSDNLNRAHLDYFFWLLAGLSGAELLVFLCFARSYVYRKK